MARLGVNIDHVATVRQARRAPFPDPIRLAHQACEAGADGITAHLREDRRHIQDRDISSLKNLCPVPLNMEMAISSSVLAVALRVKPQWVCIVPEKRQELTTEGGFNFKNRLRVKAVIRQLHSVGTKVSVFIDPTLKRVRQSKDVGADAIEIHTGVYAQRWIRNRGVERELNNIRSSAQVASLSGLLVNAGHGLDYDNVAPLLKCFDFHELNIGFSIIARSLEVGMRSAVKEMKKRMRI